MSFHRSRKPAPNSKMVGTVNMMAFATSMLGEVAAVPYAKAAQQRQPTEPVQSVRKVQRGGTCACIRLPLPV